MRRLLTLAAAAAALLAVSAAPASADSIAYIKDGNVWLSTADGSRQHQVTTTGGYSDVSQADDGTMIALTGVRLHKLDRAGNVLANFDTPVSDTRPAGQRVFFGPFDPAISPDGTRVAYTWYFMTQTQDPSCFPPKCAIAINEGGTGYSFSDRQTGWDEPGLRKHSGWRNPVWVDNETTLLSDPTHLPNADVVVDRPATRDGAFLVQTWYTDDVQGNPRTGGGDITRDRAKMAFTTGHGDSTLTLYGVPSFPTTFKDGAAPPSTYPLVCYRYSGPQGGSYGTPTFAPDGNRLAWSESDGIHIVTVPSFANGCTTEGASPTAPLVIPGASQPDWGPADVPPARQAGGSGGQVQAGGSGGQGGTGSTPARRTPKLAITRTSITKALRKGLMARLSGAKAGAATIVARLDGKIVATGRGTAAADGKLVVRLKFTKAAKRKLARRRTARLVVAGGGAEKAVVLERG